MILCTYELRISSLTTYYFYGLDEQYSKPLPGNDCLWETTWMEFLSIRHLLLFKMERKWRNSLLVVNMDFISLILDVCRSIRKPLRIGTNYLLFIKIVLPCVQEGLVIWSCGFIWSLQFISNPVLNQILFRHRKCIEFISVRAKFTAIWMALKLKFNRTKYTSLHCSHFLSLSLPTLPSNHHRGENTPKWLVAFPQFF